MNFFRKRVCEPAPDTVASHAAALFVCAELHVGSNPRECPLCGSQVRNLAQVLDAREAA